MAGVLAIHCLEYNKVNYEAAKKLTKLCCDIASLYHKMDAIYRNFRSQVFLSGRNFIRLPKVIQIQ